MEIIKVLRLIDHDGDVLEVWGERRSLVQALSVNGPARSTTHRIDLDAAGRAALIVALGGQPVSPLVEALGAERRDA